MKQKKYKAGQLITIKRFGIFRVTVHNGTMACLSCMFETEKNGTSAACIKYCMYGYAKKRIPSNCYLKLVKKF